MVFNLLIPLSTLFGKIFWFFVNFYPNAHTCVLPQVLHGTRKSHERIKGGVVCVSLAKVLEIKIRCFSSSSFFLNGEK